MKTKMHIKPRYDGDMYK